jgi:hypothetical protein
MARMTPAAISLPHWWTVRRAVLAAFVLTVVAGLVWMHALGAGHRGSAVNPHGHAAVQVPCEGHGSQPCPPAPSHHGGSVCQSGAVAQGYTVPAPQPAVSAGEPVRPMLSVATVATDAGVGTGCGPPSLTMLSISRT